MTHFHRGARCFPDESDCFHPVNLQCTTSTVSNGMSLSNALANLEGDNELPLGQATPLLEEEAGGNGKLLLYVKGLIEIELS